MIEFLVLMVGFGVGTSLAGWWSVAAIAAVWSLLRPGPAWKVGAAAAAAWATLLGFTVSWEPLSRLIARVGGALGVPGWAFVLFTPLFAMMLGWSAARVTRVVISRQPSSRTSR